MDAASLERWECHLRGVHKLSEVRKETNTPGGALASGKPGLMCPVKMIHASRLSCSDLAQTKVGAVLLLRSDLGTRIYFRPLSSDSWAAVMMHDFGEALDSYGGGGVHTHGGQLKTPPGVLAIAHDSSVQIRLLTLIFLVWA